MGFWGFGVLGFGAMEIVRLLSANLHLLYHKFRSVSAHPGRPRRRSLHETC